MADLRKTSFLGDGVPPRSRDCRCGWIMMPGSRVWSIGDTLFCSEDCAQRAIGLAAGEQRKAEGQDQVLENSDDFRVAARQLIVEFANRGRPFSSTDLRLEAARRAFPKPSHPNAWGAAFGSAAKAGIIMATGAYEKSTIPSCHAAVVAIWTGR